MDHFRRSQQLFDSQYRVTKNRIISIQNVSYNGLKMATFACSFYRCTWVKLGPVSTLAELEPGRMYSVSVVKVADNPLL
jgi:hypothetical protein